MTFSTYRHVKKVAAVVAVGAAAATIVAAAGGAAEARNVSAKFNANGVNIRANHSTSASVVGQGQKGQGFSISNWYQASSSSTDWCYGKDTSNGVVGWVNCTYVPTA